MVTAWGLMCIAFGAALLAAIYVQPGTHLIGVVLALVLIVSGAGFIAEGVKR